MQQKGRYRHGSDLYLFYILSTFYIRHLHQVEESQHIIQVGYNEQEEENCETDILGTLHELIARLAACNDLVKEEEHMSTIQGWNRKNVHERQNNAQ